MMFALRWLVVVYLGFEFGATILRVPVQMLFSDTNNTARADTERRESGNALWVRAVLVQIITGLVGSGLAIMLWHHFGHGS